MKYFGGTLEMNISLFVGMCFVLSLPLLGNLSWLSGPGTCQASQAGSAVVTERNVIFPSVEGYNLERKKFSFPDDFEGTLNLVFIAFQRKQQELVDTWLPVGESLAKSYPQLHYYELPTLKRYNRVYRLIIDNGMRSGIRDKGARSRTITLYIDKEEFRQALSLPNEDTIYVLLLDDAGRILWRTAGATTEKKVEALNALLAETILPNVQSN